MLLTVVLPIPFACVTNGRDIWSVHDGLLQLGPFRDDGGAIRFQCG